MLYAKSNASQKLDIYSALLQRAIDEGDKSSYRSYFTNAFKAIHDLTTEDKTLLEIDKSIYDVVYILFKTNFKYFKDLDKAKIDDKVFEDVKNIFGTLKQDNDLVLNG